ncbi:MAG: methionyl-tRNA formyltransferase [Tissierellaceae bacterium]|nr:methionyl-tRNA formyltransferase [Tissierellaceae bacterium]
MKIVFAGTPEFAVPTLEQLFKNGYEIPLVITQRDKPKGRGKKLQYTPVKEKALELGLNVYQPDNINSDESIEILKSLNPDFLIVVAFGQILRKKILGIPKVDSINVHASLLPKYRGAAPINWVLINGEKETGITIMKIDEGLDTGDMISKASICIDDEDDAVTIHDKLSKLGGELLVSTLSDIIENKAIYTPQNDDESSYSPMMSKAIGIIDWSKSSKDIFNQVRGLKPWPGTYTHYNDEQVKVHKIKIIDMDSQGEAGEIIDVSNEGVFVNTKDKIVVIEELQFPNKRRMKVSEYLAGNTIEKGIILK